MTDISEIDEFYENLYKSYPQMGLYIHHYKKSDKLLRGEVTADGRRWKQSCKDRYAYFLIFNRKDIMAPIWHDLFGAAQTATWVKSLHIMARKDMHAIACQIHEALITKIGMTVSSPPGWTYRE